MNVDPASLHSYGPHHCSSLAFAIPDFLPLPLLIVISCVVLLLLARLASRLFKRPAPSLQLRYKTRPSLLTRGEHAFYSVLLDAVPQDCVLLCKVNMKDVLQPIGPNARACWNKIARKHFDFVLCTEDDLRPVLAIELNDRSHERRDRKKRDALVRKATESAGLPLLEHPAQSCYNVAHLADRIHEAIHYPLRMNHTRGQPCAVESATA